MTTYEFYTETYLSGKEAVLSAASFAYWERKASNEVRNMTFGNIDESREIPKDVQMCVCEVAELLYTQDKKAKESGVASEKVGDYSVTYRVQSEGEKVAEVKNTVVQWLANSGLMYCGVG